MSKKFDPNNPPKAPSVSQVVKKLKSIDKGKKELYEYQHPVQTKFKERLGSLAKKVNKIAMSRAMNRSVLKKSNVSVRASSFNSPVENVFDDENRFFKGEMAKEKKAMFFS